MNSSTLFNPGRALQTSPGVITDEFLDVFNQLLKFFLEPALCAWAVIANTINVVVFLRMNVSDGITHNFLLLSISDVVTAVLQSAVVVCGILNIYNIHPSSQVQMRTVGVNLRFATFYPLNLSLLTTTVIAVARCICVALPFSARTLVTTSRQLVILLSLSFVSISVFSVCLGHYRLVPVFMPRANVTRIKHLINDKTLRFASILDAFRNTLFYICFCIVFVSMVILIVYLLKSVRFREMSSSASSSGQKSKTDSDGEKVKESARREAQVIKNVTVLLMFFLIGNCPAILLAIFRLAIPEFRKKDHIEHMANEVLFMQLLTGLGTEFVVGFNFFVYYSFNGRFRGIVNKMLRHS